MTLRELLIRIKGGYALYSPILVNVSREDSLDDTAGDTVTQNLERDWAEDYTREYAEETAIVVGNNSIKGLDLPVSIGRSRQCDVQVSNESVSKVHASIALDRRSGSYSVLDRGSRNGTCINGEEIAKDTKVSLWSGAYLSFGDAVYVFIDPPTLRKLARLAKD